VIKWVPTVRAEVVKVATPPARVAVPTTVVPSLNVTVPVGIPLPLVMVAVNLTGVCAAVGLADVVSLAVVTTVT
jgi:hypothetical protein